ncbi:hypothetical protein OAU50_02215 [Planctomycetota bacterium]|nr:hypothetical protein [Planctomycetota bacterium]
MSFGNIDEREIDTSPPVWEGIGGGYKPRPVPMGNPRPEFAPEALRNLEDFEAWLPSKTQREIMHSGESPYVAVYLNLRQGRPVKWADIPTFARPMNSLKEANLSYASTFAAKMETTDVFMLAQALNTKPEVDETQKRGIVAAYLAELATSQHRPLVDMQAAETTTAAGSVLSEFFNDVGDFLNEAVKKLAEAVKDAAQFVLELRASNGLIQFFFDAAGTSLMFSLLEQTANATIEGSWDGFDDQAFSLIAGQTFVAAGTVLTAVGTAIPGFGLIAVAVGAVSVALGKQIIGTQTDRDTRDAINEVLDLREQKQANLDADLEAAELAVEVAEAEVRAAELAQIHPIKKPAPVAPIAAALAVGAFLAFGV